MIIFLSLSPLSSTVSSIFIAFVECHVVQLLVKKKSHKKLQKKKKTNKNSCAGQVKGIVTSVYLTCEYGWGCELIPVHKNIVNIYFRSVLLTLSFFFHHR